jgi:basic membrane protein A
VTAVVSRGRLLRRAGAFALAAACAPVTARADAPLVALVHTQAAGDNGVVDGMIASLQRIGRERNLTVRAVYASDAANYQPMLELLGEAQAAVVLTTFNEMSQPLRAVAPAFPKTRFIQLYGDPMDPVIRNVRTVAYETYLASYLSGMCGALMSTESKIGYIGGISIPTLDANVNAMAAGAKSVRPGVGLSTAFVGSFQDPAKALEIANQLFGAGIDYVQAEGSASDLGVIQSANARLGRIVCGGSRPEFPIGPASLAAITLCDFGRSLYAQTGEALGAAWTPGHYRSSLADGVVDFVASPLFLAHGPPALVARFHDAWPRLLAAKRSIVAGSVRVPFKPNLG